MISFTAAKISYMDQVGFIQGVAKHILIMTSNMQRYIEREGDRREGEIRERRI
jgi:hypothetical protein